MTLSDIISSGRIVDVMVVFVVIEVVVLIVYWCRTGRGIPTVPLLANIGLNRLGDSLEALTVT